MENIESIGQTLKQAREARGLSLAEVHEASKITPQNLGAIEEDRFDSFPNRVYARAFLRDYANYLGLDSSALLTKYEEAWCVPEPIEPIPAPRRKSFGKKLAYSFITLIVLAGIAVGGYYAWDMYGDEILIMRNRAFSTASHKESDVAELPQAPVVAPKPETEKPTLAAKPSYSTIPPPPPDKLTLEVTVLSPVWADIKTDGNKAVYGTLPVGKKTFEAAKKIHIRVGRANAVQLILNGEPLPPLGTKSVPVTRDFELKPIPVPLKPTAFGGSPR